MNAGNLLISLKNVHKTYVTGGNRLHVLRGINLTVKAGEMVSIMGSSGSGKSTLLNIIGLLDDHDEGEYRFNGRVMKRMSETKAALLRNRHLGFVFQSFHLIPFKTALENVALPLFFQGVSRVKRNQQAMNCLDKLGLTKWADHLPNELSGGQQQRVATARAMVTNPSAILADEPTGALDSGTSREVMKIFKKINAQGITLVIITHEKDIAGMTDRILHIHDGVIKKEGSD